ncbi:MAG: lipopolysaccharide kinase InaA family protein, partial [Syntrophobacteria bacterium]
MVNRVADIPPREKWEINDPDFSPENLRGAQDILLVKKTETREVYRHGAFFIKAFQIGPIGLRVRDPGKREWNLARALHPRGLTAPPVAYANARNWSFYVAEDVSGPDLGVFLSSIWPTLNHREKRKVLEVFAGFVADVAQSGLFQPDFHLGNIIYHQSQRRFFLIDLHRAHLHKTPLNRKKRMDQLSYIMPPLWGRVSPRHFLGFVGLLSKRWPELRDRWVRYRVQKKAFWRMRRHWSKMGLRRMGKSLGKVAVGKKTLFLSRNSPGEVGRFLSTISKDSLRNDEIVLKNSRNTRCQLVKIGSVTYFLKIYRSSSRLKACSYLFRTSRTVRAWKTSWSLLVRHIPTPAPLAAIETKNPWNEIHGAVVYPRIGAGKSNTAMMKNFLSDPARSPLFVGKLAGFVWEMHEKGVFHGDCKITNFHVAPGSPSPFTVFDLDGTKIGRRLSDKQRLSDLADLCASLEWWAVRENLTEEMLDLYIT